MFHVVLYMILIFCLDSVANAQTRTPEQIAPKEVVQIDKDSPERKAILDVVRGSIERKLGIKVVFQVRQLIIFREWAYANLRPRTEKNARIDYRQTLFAKDYLPDMDSDQIDVLLRREGNSWSIVEEAFLPTDVITMEWRDKHKLPNELLALPVTASTAQAQSPALPATANSLDFDAQRILASFNGLRVIAGDGNLVIQSPALIGTSPGPTSTSRLIFFSAVGRVFSATCHKLDQGTGWLCLQGGSTGPVSLAR